MRKEEKAMGNLQAGDREKDGHICGYEYEQLVIHRLSRAIGHLESVKKMAEEGRDCTDVLIQLAAVRGAISSISRIILKDYMEDCLLDSLKSGNHDALDALNRAIDQMIR